jgi:hypothetical protein
VIWTRAPRDNGILNTIQGWFNDAGFEPRALVVGERDLFGVSAAQFCGQHAETHSGVQLFGEYFR